MSNTVNNKLIAAIGKINVDLVFGGLKRLPDTGEELYSESFDVLLGGGAPASLYAAASLGASVRYVGYLGKSFFAPFVEKELAAKGIPFENVYAGNGSGINVTCVMPVGGERSFVTYSDESVADEDRVYEALKGASVVIAEYGKYLSVYRRLKREGAVVAGDFGFDENMDINAYAETLKAMDYYFPNEKEACLMTGKSNAREALDELAKYVPHPVVTLASEGAMFIENGEKVTLPAPKGDCIDATGAGDAFMGGFLYALNEGKSLAECVRFALAAGTATVGVKGCYADRSAYEEIRLGSGAEKNNGNI